MPQRMSLLERMIERLTTQRACLNHGVGLRAGLPGPGIELGLGKARTYDHLRRLVPEREILVFDREIHAPPFLVPDPSDLYLGDFRDTLPGVVERRRGTVALLHADIGSHDRDRDLQLVTDILPLLDQLMRVAGVVISDREMSLARWHQLPLPPEAGRWSYHMYRVAEQGQ